jgi:hypothetical protein
LNKAKEILLTVAVVGAVAFGVFIVYGPELMTAAERIQRGEYPFELHRKEPQRRTIYEDNRFLPNFLIPPFMRSNAGYLYDTATLAAEEEKYEEPWALQH